MITFVGKIDESKCTMTKYFAFIFISCVTLCSCHKRETPTPAYAAYIAYIDSSGHDLFTDGSNGYIVDSVRLYYYLNGVKTLVNNDRPGVRSAMPWGVAPFTHLYDTAAYSGLEIQTNFGIVNDSTTIFIDLKPGVEDTLACKFIEGGYVLDLTWYNRVPKMIASGQENPFFIVVK